MTQSNEVAAVKGALARNDASSTLALFVTLSLLGTNAAVAQPTAVEALGRLSLEELAHVEVSSVSKSPQSLSSAPAAIFVLTQDDIGRAGALSIPEALRLVPNLQVTQLASSNYVVTARGFGGSPAAQNFSNKLLILIDGRSVYTPLFSGIYYDAQDVLMDDIERIEVISGPGATLWGANAMNGVINIITRDAAQTQGTSVRLAGGNQDKDASVRYGGSAGEQVTYRVYGKAFEREPLKLINGASAEDGWWHAQGGFRLDWTQAGQRATLQGDAYHGIGEQLNGGDVTTSGANLLSRWLWTTDRSEIQLQGYFDQVERSAPAGGTAFVQRTYDLELQQRFTAGTVHQFVIGAGQRLSNYDITNTSSLLFLPSHDSLWLRNLFAQDTISLGKQWKLTLGIKAEDDPYTSWTLLPDARLAWHVGEQSLLWLSASQAIRSPTPFDVDVVERVGGVDFLRGNPDFETEKVTAYEVGYRTQPWNDLSLSVSVFYNDYGDLRTIEPAARTFVPLRWDNLMEGHTYGAEAWANVQILPWWRLSPGIRLLEKRLEFKRGASGLLGLGQAGNDPQSQASLRSSMDLSASMSFDVFLRYVDSLPEPLTPSYYELNARLSWHLSDQMELAIDGRNLLNPQHSEFAPPDGELIERAVSVDLRFNF